MDNEYGEFSFSIVVKEGGLVHSYSVTEKTTHGPLSQKDKNCNEL
jgi:hypothetical protein